jgi:hypothetical protein
MQYKWFITQLTQSTYISDRYVVQKIEHMFNAEITLTGTYNTFRIDVNIDHDGTVTEINVTDLNSKQTQFIMQCCELINYINARNRKVVTKILHLGHNINENIDDLIKRLHNIKAEYGNEYFSIKVIEQWQHEHNDSEVVVEMLRYETDDEHLNGVKAELNNQITAMTKMKQRHAAELQNIALNISALGCEISSLKKNN